MSKVLVVGSYNTDITVYSDRFPLDGETIFGNSVNIGIGGKGSNQATAAARMGVEVEMLCAIGNDNFKSTALNHFDNENINHNNVQILDKENTGTAIIDVSGINGQNRITVVRGANGAINKQMIKAAEDSFISSDVILIQLEITLEAIYEAISLGNKHNKTVILNPAPACKLDTSYFKYIDYFTPNEKEAEFYTGIHITDINSAKNAAHILKESGIKNVIITLGEKGAYIDAQCGEYYVKAIKRDSVVDTTGAGDCFSGAFAACLSKGINIEESTKIANVASSLEIMKKGAALSMPYYDEVIEEYNKEKSNI